MNVLVFGATGGIGGYVIERAIAVGHQVTAFVRDPMAARPADVTRAVGDLGDLASMERAVEGCDAVIWAVGVTSNTADQVPIFEAGARNLVTAMQHHGVRRLVALSGAAITINGERKPLGDRITSALVSIRARHVVAAKQREYEVFSGSNLDWTLIRPPRVVEGQPTSSYVVGDALVGRSITQGDLAESMVHQLNEMEFVRAAPYVSAKPGGNVDTSGDLTSHQ